MGRPSKGADALTRQVFARLTSAQHVTYLASGGADWLRAQVNAERARQRTQPTPSAHNPFPAIPQAEPAPPARRSPFRVATSRRWFA